MFVGISALILGGCQSLRGRVEKKYKPGETRKIKKTPMVIHLFHNEGVAGSRLENRPETAKLLATVAAVLVSAVFVMTLPLRGRRALKLGLSFVVGGGLSNMLERHRYGFVTDYVQFDVPCRPLAKLIFNVADFFVFLGLLIATLAACIEE